MKLFLCNCLQERHFRITCSMAAPWNECADEWKSRGQSFLYCSRPISLSDLCSDCRVALNRESEELFRVHVSPVSPGIATWFYQVLEFNPSHSLPLCKTVEWRCMISTFLLSGARARCTKQRSYADGLRCCQLTTLVLENHSVVYISACPCSFEDSLQHNGK